MLKGHCHCGQTGWEYSNALDSVTACNCTLCRRYGTLWAYGYVGEGITTSGETDIYSMVKTFLITIFVRSAKAYHTTSSILKTPRVKPKSR